MKKRIVTFLLMFSVLFVLAACGSKTFKVTFNADGGTPVPAVQEVEKDKVAKKPANPSKEGYDFIEWQLGGKKFDFATKITGDITLKAKWEEIPEEGSFRVSFDSNGGSSVASINVLDGNKVAKPADPTRTGFNFVEWQLNGVAYDFNTAVTAAITLVAKWEAKETGGPAGRPTEIVIMHGAVNEVDPRHKDYSGTEKAARIALHEQIEEDLNVKITYKPYPANAPWGPGRQEAIINWHLADNAQADIYWITTIWLGDIIASNAIVPIDKWINKYGRNIDEAVLDMTTIDGATWGMSPEPFFGEKGLFYNVELLEEYGLEDPVALWNAGQWNWTKFEEFTTLAKTKMTEEQYVLGGVPGKYAESLVPLNGGYMVNTMLERVGINSNQANEVYDFLTALEAKKLFEPSGTYDAGSDQWAAGDVLFHPGSLWFVRADNRWGQYDFVKNGKIGVVPYPLPDSKSIKDYKIPLGGEAIYTIAANPGDKAKEELAFEVWNRIQVWETLGSYADNFEDSLIRTFDEEKFIDVYMQIYDRVYYDAYEDIGISMFGASSWYAAINAGVKDGSTRSKIEEIIDVYEEYLLRFLGKYEADE